MAARRHTNGKATPTKATTTPPYNNNNNTDSPSSFTTSTPRQSTTTSPAQPQPQPQPHRPFTTAHSPADSPSISQNLPFDWDAARGLRPAPYPAPFSGRRKAGAEALKRKDGDSISGGSPRGAGRRVVRKKSLYQKITSFPENLLFKIDCWRDEVPLPTPHRAAHYVGGFLHFISICVRVSRIRQVPDSDLGWEDMYREDVGEAWFDWTIPTTLLLILASTMSALHLFSRTKLYYFHNRPSPLPSPHASFAPLDLSSSPSPSFDEDAQPPLKARVARFLWTQLKLSLGFKVHEEAKTPRGQQGQGQGRVQTLEVWTPSEFDARLVSIYSPAHALLWVVTTNANWVLMAVVMVLVGFQTHFLMASYETLILDKKIIQEEVLREYNEKFVNPRVNPIRRDAATQTNQAEMVRHWDE